MNEQQLTKIDENNTKAMAILKNLIFALEMDADVEEQINVLCLVEAACDYLNDTNRIFQNKV